MFKSYPEKIGQKLEESILLANNTLFCFLSANIIVVGSHVSRPELGSSQLYYIDMSVDVIIRASPTVLAIIVG